MTTRVLVLVIAGALSGCTAERLVRDNIVPECPGTADRATSRAASCMAAALYEIAVERDDASHDQGEAQKDGGDEKR